MQRDSFNISLFLIEIGIRLTQIAFLRFFVLSMCVMELMINTQDDDLNAMTKEISRYINTSYLYC